MGRFPRERRSALCVNDEEPETHAVLNETDATPAFSSRWARLVVPGIGTIQGLRAQASERRAGLTFLRRAQVCTSRTRARS